ncbi:plasmid recombination protein [Pseudomonas sp. CAH-1]|uniref:plasmid recombination protein n=1 Tax=Pseudomonas sp. CAH-1 TaxID=2605744 RepID=UPI00237A933C|nr:plasmid recombination protein [Pseudomonas sp. CAH-1]
MTDSKGRKLRKDALCLAAGVVSAPHDIEPEAWASFKADALKWLQDKYGECLRTVIEHTDESHPHLHFYCVAQPGQRFESVHQGKAAAAEAKAEGKPKGQQNQAYKAAMREFQDEFFDQVGMRHGFSRLGPGKRRLTREEWRQEQAQAKALAVTIERAEALTEATAIERQAIITEAKAEAKTVAEKALQNADRIEKQAAAKGWKAALDAFEALPWFKRVKAVIGRAVTQRDALQERVDALQEERKGMVERIRTLFSAGKAHRDELLEVKPKLQQAERDLARSQRDASQVEQLRKRNEALEGRVQHLEAVNEALQPPAPAEPEKAVKRSRGAAMGESLDA